MSERVNTQFHSLKSNVDRLDKHLAQVEGELTDQETLVKHTISERKKQAEREIQAAEHLLKNVKGAFRVQKQQLDNEQERLIKEVQAILKNDELQWEQIKTQTKYRLERLMTFE